MEWKPEEKARILYLAKHSRMTIFAHDAERLEKELHSLVIAAGAHPETQLFSMLLESVELHLRLTNTQLRSIIMEPAKD